MPTDAKRIEFPALLINILIPLLFGVAGGLITIDSVHSWYPGIVKPSFNPPNWLFGPVWSLLFIIMGISAYRVWTHRKKIAHLPRTAAIYFIQLILNLGWSYLFFYRHLIGAALIEIGALLVAILVNATVFYKIDKTAGLLFIPYFLWVSFATILTYNIFLLN
ncbi:MAG: tryptophan-rich sensory protein [Pedobacter sp.]|nr:tryptophan-rich sensory protein [Pedobacter sp.]